MYNQKPPFSHILFLQGFFYTNIISITIIVAASFLFIRAQFRESSLITLIGVTLLPLFIGNGIQILIGTKQYRRITLLMEQGYQTTGKIIEKYLYWGRGYIVYEYKHHGQVYRASENFSWRQSKKFKIGQEITVFVNYQSPRQSLLYDLYQ